MKLQEQLQAAQQREADTRAAQQAEQSKRNREQTMDLVVQAFGEKTGEKEPRPGYGGMERDVKRLPEGMVASLVDDRRVMVDGILFTTDYDRNANRQLRPVLVCPACGEEHVGSAVHGNSHYQMVTLANEVAAQRADNHRCYEAGTAAVLAAARRGADRAKGITAAQLLQRASQQVGFGDF